MCERGTPNNVELVSRLSAKATVRQERSARYLEEPPLAALFPLANACLESLPVNSGQ